MNKIACLALAVFSACAFKIQASGITLAWDPNPEPDIAGYRIYYNVLGAATIVIDVGLKTSVPIKNLEAGLVYRFYATAYNTEGLESAPSAEVTYTVPGIPRLDLDSDSDGLTDTLELLHNLNPYDPTDADADPDGDGLSSREELASGTNPYDVNSSFRISAVVERTAGLGIRFASAVGQVYTLEANDDFPDGPWFPVVTGILGTGFTIQALDPNWNGSSRRMYRITTSGLSGAQVSTSPAGFSRTLLAGTSDTITSPPLFRFPAFEGAVSYVSGDVVAASGASWVVNRFVYSPGMQTNTYFLLVRSGEREGDYFTITANDDSSVTVDTAANTLDGLQPGDTISIVPYWTLGTLFPGGQGIIPSIYPGVRNSEVIMPDLAADGVNAATARTYYFWQGAWRAVGFGSSVLNDDVVLPDAFFWVRNQVAVGTELMVSGFALDSKWRFRIQRGVKGKQDNILAMPRPSALTLNASGLAQSGAFRSSPSPLNRLDELLVFNTEAVMLNKPISATYYFWDGGWRRLGSGATDVGNDVIFKPGTGFIIRAGVGDGPGIWLSDTGY